MLDIYRYASCLSIFPPLFTFPLGDSCILFTLRAEPSFVFLIEEGKKRLCLNHIKPLRSPQPNSSTSQSCSLSSNYFFRVQASVYWYTDGQLLDAQLLDLGWKLYPSNMLVMLNEYLYSNHADYFSSTPKSSKQKKVSAGGWLLFPLRSTVSEIWAQKGYANCTHSKFWGLGLFL